MLNRIVFNKKGISCFACILLAAIMFSLQAQAASVPGFPELERRAVTFWSDGTRLAGDITYPKDAKEGDKLPALVMCHGWGGEKAHLNMAIGPQFAREGYVVFTFDYRGWGQSDSRLVVTGEMPMPDADGMVTVKAQAIRELVDPLDQQEDIDAAITFIEGEPMVDSDRIGLWGSSFGGGHVIYRAANDSRIKCVLAQVGSMDSRIGLLPQLKQIEADAIKRVRGELPPVPLGADKPAGLRGDPYYDRFIKFVPADHAHKITCPVLLLDGDLEHYFDYKDHGERVFSIIKDNVPSEYHLLKDTKHYDVYSKSLKQVMSYEVPFLNKHLRDKK